LSPRDFSRTLYLNPDPAPQLPSTDEVEAEGSRATQLWRCIEAQSEAASTPPSSPSWERKALADSGPCTQCGRPASAVCYGMCAVCVSEDATSESQFLQARRASALGAKDQKR